MEQILHSPEITKVFLDWAIKKPFVAFVLEPNHATPKFYSFKTLDSLIDSAKSLAVLNILDLSNLCSNGSKMPWLPFAPRIINRLATFALKRIYRIIKL